MRLSFVYALAEFALIEMLELFDVFFGELHMSRRVQSVFHASNCVKIRAGVEVELAVPVGFYVAFKSSVSSENELRLVRGVVFIHGMKFVFQAEQRARQSKVEGREEILL